jgi:transposase InsO family protein
MMVASSAFLQSSMRLAESVWPCWLHAGSGVQTLYMTPGSPWENGYCESFNGSLRDELLNGEIFYSLADSGSASLHLRSTLAKEAIMH